MGRRGWADGGWDGSMFCTEPFSSCPQTPKDTLYQSPGASQWPLGCLGLGLPLPPEPPQLVLAGPVRPQVAVGAGLGNESLVCSHSDGMGIGSYLGPASLYGQVKSPVGCTSSSTTYLGFR